MIYTTSDSWVWDGMGENSQAKGSTGKLTTSLQKPPLTGREAEMRRLQDRLDQARQGWGGRMAILGESGIGKTRLAEELAAQAAGDGTKTLLVTCRGSMLRPYEPLAELVRSLLDIDSSLRTDAQRLPLTQSLEGLGLRQFEPTFARLLRLEGSSPMPKVQASMLEASPGALDFAEDLESEQVTSTVHDLTSQIDLGDMLRILLTAMAEPGKGILLFKRLVSCRRDQPVRSTCWTARIKAPFCSSPPCAPMRPRTCSTSLPKPR
jgi:hypothetical protein